MASKSKTHCGFSIPPSSLPTSVAYSWAWPAPWLLRCVITAEYLFGLSSPCSALARTASYVPRGSPRAAGSDGTDEADVGVDDEKERRSGVRAVAAEEEEMAAAAAAAAGARILAEVRCKVDLWRERPAAATLLPHPRPRLETREEIIVASRGADARKGIKVVVVFPLPLALARTSVAHPPL